MATKRLEQAAEMMRQAGFAALVVRLPEHVVSLTGYQPVLGNTFLLISLAQGGGVELRMAAPDEEVERAQAAAPIQMETYTEETMTWIGDTIQAVREPMQRLLARANLPADAVVGVESGRRPVAVGYTQVGVPGFGAMELLRELLPGATLRDASDLLYGIEAVKNEEELAAIRLAERAAIAGMRAGREAARPGASEADVAAAVYAALTRAGYQQPGVWNVQPFVHVMAGRRAALAYRAYNMTSSAVIEPGDPVIVQLEVGLNGYWSELSHPFFAGSVSETWQSAYTACLRAQEAALGIIREGARGRDVDAAARGVMEAAGFGKAFKHGVGHGFGLQAINHAAAPVLHPASDAVLRAGMTHNLEPAVYLDDLGGIRLNDDVAVKTDGYELLSADLPRDLEWHIAPA